MADVKCCSSKSFRKSVFCHQSVIHTPLIQKKVINTHNQHPLIIVIRCWCIFCDNNLLEEIASQHQETLLLKVKLQNIRVTKTLILKGIECNFYNVLFIRSFCKQMILKQIERQVGLYTTADACHHLDESITLFTDELILIDVSLDFHVIVILSIKNFCELSQNHSVLLFPI